MAHCVLNAVNSGTVLTSLGNHSKEALLTLYAWQGA